MTFRLFSKGGVFETVGFIFDRLGNVLLIEKTHPERLAGYLNGVGGKAEPGEKPCQCMAREANQECGLVTTADDWVYVDYIVSEGEKIVHFFAIIVSNTQEISSQEEERVAWYPFANLPSNAMHDIPEFLLLARQKLTNTRLQ